MAEQQCRLAREETEAGASPPTSYGQQWEPSSFFTNPDPLGGFLPTTMVGPPNHSLGWKGGKD